MYEPLILPNTTHWNHPGFFAYFPSNSLPSSVLGDYLATGLGTQVWINNREGRPGEDPRVRRILEAERPIKILHNSKFDARHMLPDCTY